MSNLSCPHCGASNVAGAQFCAACGKALPVASAGGPRVVTASSLPATAAGQQMLGDQLLKHTKRAANTLLVVGIVQAVFGGGLILFLKSQRGVNPEIANQLNVLLVIQLIIAGCFIGLSFWARKAPLPASIVGLVLYGTLVIYNVVSNAAAMREAGPGARGSGIGGLGIGWLDIVIIVFLVRGIQAALDHRKLANSQPTL